MNDSDEDTIEFEIEVVSSSSSCVSLNELAKNVVIEKQQVVDDQIVQETFEEKIIEAAAVEGHQEEATDKRQMFEEGNNLSGTEPNNSEHRGPNAERDETRDRSNDNNNNNELYNDNTTEANCRRTGPLESPSEIQLMAQQAGAAHQVAATDVGRQVPLVHSNNGSSLEMANNSLLGVSGGPTEANTGEQQQQQSTLVDPSEQQLGGLRVVDNPNAIDQAEGFVRSQAFIKLAPPTQELEERIPLELLKLEQKEDNNNYYNNNSNNNNTTDSGGNNNSCHEINGQTSEEQSRGACCGPAKVEHVAAMAAAEATTTATAHDGPADLNEVSNAFGGGDNIGTEASQADLDLEADRPANRVAEVAPESSSNEAAPVEGAADTSPEVERASSSTVSGDTLAISNPVAGEIVGASRLASGAKECELVAASNGWTLVRESLARMTDGWLLIEESEALEIEPVARVEPLRCVDSSSGGQAVLNGANSDGSPRPTPLDSVRAANGAPIKLPISESGPGDSLGRLEDHPGGGEDLIEQESPGGADQQQQPARGAAEGTLDSTGDNETISSDAPENDSQEAPVTPNERDHPPEEGYSGPMDGEKIFELLPAAAAGRERLSLDIGLPARGRQRLSFSLVEDDNLEREFDEEPEFERRQVQVKRNLNPRDEYELGAELGKGRFGTVYRCTELASGRSFAAKFVHLRRQEDRQDVEREVHIMSLLQHRRLLQLYDAFDDGHHEMCLITELVEGGELFERIVDDDFELTERKAAIFMRQICEGVDYMHGHQIVHLDMKPENILCLSRTGNRIKLIDFGLARQLAPEEPLRVMFGTPDFAAPEVLAYEPVSLATDMWSVGVICYVLLSGLSPFMGDSDMETMANVLRATYDFEAQAFEPISELARDFIAKLLVREAAGRLKPSACLQHPWLQRGGALLEAAVRERRESSAASLAHRRAIDQMQLQLGPLSATGPAGWPIGGGAQVSSSSANSSADTTLSIISLDKRNLKRYVVRRKWHKTVHAIMALGRMGANLKLKL